MIPFKQFFLEKAPKEGTTKRVRTANSVEHVKRVNGRWVFHREDGPAIEYAVGTKEWWLNGKLHREDGPAVEYSDGSKEWCVNGIHHREDGPAIEKADGTKKWYVNGLCHREDNPAAEHPDGTREWYKHGELHREDGPAVEYSDGAQQWFINGKLHREDGPALVNTQWNESPEGDWYIHGQHITGPELLRLKTKLGLHNPTTGADWSEML